MSSDESAPGKRFLWNVVALVLLALVAYNLYSGVTVQRIGIPGIFEVEYAGANDAGAVTNPDAPPQEDGAAPVQAGMTGTDRLDREDRDALEERQQYLEAKIQELEAQLEDDPPPARPGIVSIAGTWMGQQGISYQFQQVGTDIVFSEINPLLGVTASGTGTLNGTVLTLNVTTAAYTNGTASLRLDPDGMRLTGTYRDAVTGMVVPLVLTR